MPGDNSNSDKGAGKAEQGGLHKLHVTLVLLRKTRLHQAGTISMLPLGVAEAATVQRAFNRPMSSESPVLEQYQHNL